MPELMSLAKRFIPHVFRHHWNVLNKDVTWSDHDYKDTLATMRWTDCRRIKGVPEVGDNKNVAVFHFSIQCVAHRTHSNLNEVSSNSHILGFMVTCQGLERWHSWPLPSVSSSLLPIGEGLKKGNWTHSSLLSRPLLPLCFIGQPSFRVQWHFNDMFSAKQKCSWPSEVSRDWPAVSMPGEGAALMCRIGEGIGTLMVTAHLSQGLSSSLSQQWNCFFHLHLPDSCVCLFSLEPHKGWGVLQIGPLGSQPWAQYC